MPCRVADAPLQGAAQQLRTAGSHTRGGGGLPAWPSAPPPERRSSRRAASGLSCQTAQRRPGRLVGPRRAPEGGLHGLGAGPGTHKDAGEPGGDVHRRLVQVSGRLPSAGWQAPAVLACRGGHVSVLQAPLDKAVGSVDSLHCKGGGEGPGCSGASAGTGRQQAGAGSARSAGKSKVVTCCWGAGRKALPRHPRPATSLLGAGPPPQPACAPGGAALTSVSRDTQQHGVPAPPAQLVCAALLHRPADISLMATLDLTWQGRQDGQSPGTFACRHRPCC